MGTSEQQLLGVIEKSSPGTAGARRAAGSRGFFSNEGARNLAKRVRSEALRISTLNLLLVGAIIVASVYLAFDIVASARESRRAFDLSGNPRSAAGVKAKTQLGNSKELSYYEERIGDRDIFRIGGKLTRSTGEETVSEQAVISDAARDLRLVGVAWSDRPDVMIEDSAKGVTYFLHEGEAMENGMRVKEVSREHVLLEYQQEIITLK